MIDLIETKANPVILGDEQSRPPELLPPSVSSVPADWPQASSWHFEGFALDITPWRCKCCSDEIVHSQLFRMFVRHFPSTTDRRMVPAHEFVRDFPVIRFIREPRYTQICSKCVNTMEGNKQFKVCSEDEFRAAAKQAQIELASKPKPKSNVVPLMTKTQIAAKLENLI